MEKTINLQKGDMQIKVLLPYSPAYTRTRFNHAGIVSSILYKGLQFAEPEQRDPSRSTTEGVGLSSQINCINSELEAREGEKFLRLGIGVMTRERDLIPFMRDGPYQPLDIRVDAGVDSAVFTTSSPSINGYAYEERRTITVGENSISITESILNCGEKPIDGTEYNHNFLSLGGLTVGPDYRLELPFCLGIENIKKECGLVPDGQGVTWEKTPEKAFFCEFRDVADVKPPFAWKLSHRQSPASVRELVDFAPEHITVWGTESCACTEVFVPFSAAPGQSVKWTRKWIFEA